jgi:AcrR family transcriptional regulator
MNLEPEGDLRHRILATARHLLDEGGVAALSLREVARRAGVTHQAPYHHFKDRETIVAHLVQRGFDDLADRLSAVNHTADGLPPERTLIASGLAYVRFALDEPGVFRVMFRPELCDAARFPQAQAAGERAHAELRRMVHLVTGHDDEVQATSCWGLAHGLACLLLDGPLGQAAGDTPSRLNVAEAALRSLIPSMLPAEPPPLAGAKPTRRARTLAARPQSASSKGE